MQSERAMQGSHVLVRFILNENRSMTKSAAEWKLKNKIAWSSLGDETLKERSTAWGRIDVSTSSAAHRGTRGRAVSSWADNKPDFPRRPTPQSVIAAGLPGASAIVQPGPYHVPAHLPLTRARNISKLEWEGQGDRLEPTGCPVLRGALGPLIHDASPEKKSSLAAESL